MISVPEDRFEVVLGSRRPVIGRKLMTDTALAEFAFRRVAPVTGRMCLEPARDGFARPRWIVTSYAALSGASVAFFMHGVVEAHIESLDEFCRKCFHRRVLAFCVRVT